MFLIIVQKAKLPNDIMVVFYHGGIEESSAIIVSKDNSNLYYEYSGAWLSNWDLKLKEPLKS
jgi:hypothetical protein